MNLPILIGTIAIELIIIVGVGWVLNLISKKKMDAAEFTTANRSMPAITVGATQALTCLGGGHIMGMVGAGWSYGVGTYWYALSSGFMLIIMLCFTGPWIRRFGFTTINQLFAKMFDHKTSVIMAGIAAGTVWGILTLELQGVGTVLGAITGWDIAFGCAVGGILSLLYVLFGGMKQVGWVNVINAIFMYVVAIIAIFMIGSNLPSGWEGVNNFFVSNSEDWKLSSLANPNTWQTYIIGTILAQLFYCPIGPQAAQVSASAKNVDAIRKSVMIAVPINVVFGAIMLAFGMAAQSIPEYAAIGNPPLANFTMLLNSLPGWLVSCLFAAFIAAMLSTVAVQILALATIFLDDIVYKFYKKDATEKQKVISLRVAVTVFAEGGTALSTTLPAIDSAIVWLFAWLLPAFWVFVFGMFWKRSSRAAFWTLIITAIANMIWSFTSLPTLLHLDGNNNSVGMVVVSFVVGIILTATDKNAKPGMIKLYKTNKSAAISKEYAAELRAQGKL